MQKRNNRDNSIYKSIKNSKILRNELNQGGERFMQWKLQNTALKNIDENINKEAHPMLMD